jgi:hypothetical protein
MSISTTITAGHSATARLDIHEVVRRLNNHLGPLLVATLAGSKDPKLPHKWAKPVGGSMPGPAFQKRLLLAHRVWIAIADAESDAIARAWFLGGNPFLGEDTPITAIREDRHKEVAQAPHRVPRGSTGRLSGQQCTKTGLWILDDFRSGFRIATTIRGPWIRQSVWLVTIQPTGAATTLGVPRCTFRIPRRSRSRRSCLAMP